MGNPATVVTWSTTTLTDQHPTLGQLQFTFPYRMEANPLTDVAPNDPTIRGSQPDNKALWWPFFRERHKTGPLFWVQGHCSLGPNAGKDQGSLRTCSRPFWLSKLGGTVCSDASLLGVI
jgi:hypothetical protein